KKLKNRQSSCSVRTSSPCSTESSRTCRVREAVRKRNRALDSGDESVFLANYLHIQTSALAVSVNPIVSSSKRRCLMANRILDSEIAGGNCTVGAPRTGDDVSRHVHDEAGIGVGSVAGEPNARGFASATVFVGLVLAVWLALTVALAAN